MTQLLEDLLHARTGPMTAELVQRPGEFGLARVPARLKPASTVNSVCGFCATGCNLKVHLDETGAALNLSPDPNYPVNLGMACPKGWEALTPLQAPDRATQPLLRNGTGALEPASWSEAVGAMTTRFKAIQAASGSEAVAVLSTGQIVAEEMAFLGALAKFGMGIAHIDSNTRQCMATAHVAYKQSFGYDAPPYTYADFELSDVLVLIGANPCIAHPIMWQRVMRNRNQPKIIVIDPRRTETAMLASQHCPIRPKSDLVLFYGLARELIHRGAVDAGFIGAHTTGFEEFKDFVQDYDLARTCDSTGLGEQAFQTLATTIAEGKRVSFWWTMGVNQGHQATRTAQAIINLALMTGNIGRPGTGANSITGQCNAMGSRLYGNATSLVGGYDFANPEHRSHVAGILGIDETLIPRQASLAYDQILDGIDEGRIKGLWVIATNTAHSWIGSRRFEQLRRKLECLVVQDMFFTTETARMADVILPAAGWGEKEGVFINSERRLGVARKVARAPGRALSDFAIFQLVARSWGCEHMFARWTSPAAAFGIMKELSRGRPSDISGIRDYAHLDEAGGIQWPYAAAGAAAGESESASGGEPDVPRPSSELPAHERRLFEDGRFFTPDGRARFYFDPPAALPEPPDEEYPLLLLTGRGSSAQWHTGTRTNKSDVLRKLAPRSLHVELNPEDARRLKVTTGDPVSVRSRRGELEASALVTPTVQAGQLFLPMHFAEVNRLTFPVFDPHSRQPGYKACAVRVDRI